MLPLRMFSLPAFSRARVVLSLLVSLTCGFAVGAGANAVVGSKLTLPENVEIPDFEDAPSAPVGEGSVVASAPEAEGTPGLPTEQKTSVRMDKRMFIDGVVRRNIFDSAATFGEGSGDVASQDCKESKSLVLATVVSDLPQYSSALISDGGKSSRASGYAVGDVVGSEGKIRTIEQKKVCMEDGGCLCMGGEERKVASAGTEEGTTDGEGVTKVSDTKYLVDRSFLEKQLGNVETLATQIRASPKTEDGSVVGFRLSAIRKGSVFDKLGIKNGDVVHTVNGATLTSMEAVMGAYGSLQNERGFNFEITRRNQKMTIEYEVR